MCGYTGFQWFWLRAYGWVLLCWGLDFRGVQEGWGRIQDGCRECSYRDAG